MDQQRQKRWPVTTVILLFVAVITLSGCSTVDNNASQSSAPKEVAIETVQQKGISLEDAYRKIGMECKGPDFQAKCSWNGVSFTISKPSDWDKDVKLRNKACDEGYIDPQYLLVSDNKSWHISTDYHKDTVNLSEALVKEGIDAQMIRYCY